MPASETIIEWRCDACNERGRFANLPDATIKHIRNAVRDGHERRALRCHDKRGAAKVKVQLRGKILSFLAIEALIAGNGAVEAPESHDQSSGNTAALAQTPTPSTAK